MDKRKETVRRNYSQNELGDLIRYLNAAGVVYGKAPVELEGLTYYLNHGEFDFDNWILRRNEILFDLYEKYKSNSFNEGFKMSENGVYHPREEDYVISKERQNRWMTNYDTNQPGIGWIMTPSLDYFMVSPNAKSAHTVTEKYHNLSEKNSFLLPQIAKQLDIPATVYYRGVIKRGKDKRKVHLSKSFIEPDEVYVAAYGFVPSKRKRDNKVSMQTLLDSTKQFMLDDEGMHGIDPEDTLARYEEIRKGIIKQTFFYKLTLHDEESNDTWGLTAGRDHRYHLAPLRVYEPACEAKTLGYNGKGCHRTVSNGLDDIQSFMLEYSKEDWFKKWLEDRVLNLDMDKAFVDTARETKVFLNSKEREYYSEVFTTMLGKVQDVFDLEFDHSEVGQMIQTHRRAKRIAKVKSKVRRIVRNQDDTDEHII